MSHFCNDVENGILNACLGIAALTKTTSLTLHLHTGDPGEAGTASEATGYTPPAIVFGAPAAGTGNNRKIANTSTHAITISSTQTITHFSVWDQASAKWVRGVFASPILVTGGGDLDVDAGDIEVELSGEWTATIMDAVLNALRSNANMDFTTAVYEATLCTGDPGAGVLANELAGITRQSVTWNTVAAGATTNNGAITWPTVASQTAAWFALVRQSDGQVFYRDDIADATDTDFRIQDGAMSASVD